MLKRCSSRNRKGVNRIILVHASQNKGRNGPNIVNRSQPQFGNHIGISKRNAP
jgi:hypothetical protein